MPQRVINSSNIDTLVVALVFDIYNRNINVNSAATTYNDASGSGQLYVQGIDVKIEDQDGVILHDYDWNDPLIKPQDGEDNADIDLSSFSIPFLFQTYKITTAIKDGNGTIYYTNPVFKKICQPQGLTESGYVPGIFQVAANCMDNIITIKELTPLVYNNLTPDSTTKSGTLSYPTGTISPITFTGTPFTNNVIYTGQYRISCTTESIYNLQDEVFVKVTYLTNNVFDINCSSKMSDVICCLVDLQTTAIAQCNNAIGKNAQQKLAEATMPFLIGLTKEINGQDSSAEAIQLKKLLKCNCGATSLTQNEFTPINPAVTNIVLIGTGGTTITSSTTGNTKTYNIGSTTFQVVKGDTGDLAFTITTDTSTSGVVKYKITFNYAIMAQYILDAIAADPTLLALFNSLVENSGLSLVGLDGKCIIDLSACNYSLERQISSCSELVTSVTINGTVYNAPVNMNVCTEAPIQNWLNSLGLGTFSVSIVKPQFLILSVSNTNVPSVMTFSNGNSYQFATDCYQLIDILQAIINYLCELTALQVALGRALDLCHFDYNGNVVSVSYSAGQKQDDFNQGVATSICNIVARIDTLTGITCAKMVALFTDSESSTFSSVARAYGNDGVNCVGWTPKQIALGVISAIQSYPDVKDAFCAIDCEAPSSCPDISNISLAMAGANIGVYGLTWATPTPATQTVTVQYKLSSNATWITATNSLQILANGNISGTTPFEIAGIVAGSTYDVRIVNNCGGVGFSKQITAPTGTVYSGSFLLDTSIYNICGNTPITLYSNAPFAVGVIMYTDAGLTTPVTGSTYIADNNTGEIFGLNTSTGEVEASTGSSCDTGTSGLYLLGNNTTTICSQTQQVLYTNGAFAVGGTLYSDSALTSPVTGSSYVLNSANGQIYNLNSSTGQIGASTGLGCATYSIASRASASSGTVCSAPLTTRYSSNFPAPGVTIYTDINLTIPLTGFSFYVFSSTVYTINPVSGVLGVGSGDFC